MAKSSYIGFIYSVSFVATLDGGQLIYGNTECHCLNTEGIVTLGMVKMIEKDIMGKQGYQSATVLHFQKLGDLLATAKKDDDN